MPFSKDSYVYKFCKLSRFILIFKDKLLLDIISVSVFLSVDDNVAVLLK